MLRALLRASLAHEGKFAKPPGAPPGPPQPPPEPPQPWAAARVVPARSVAAVVDFMLMVEVVVGKGRLESERGGDENRQERT